MRKNDLLRDYTYRLLEFLHYLLVNQKSSTNQYLIVT